MAEKSGFVDVALSVTFVLLLSSSVSNGQVVFTTQPMNVTVCLTQGTTATFTCVVEDRGGLLGIVTAGWHIRVGEVYVPIPQNRRPRHMTNDTINGDIITDTLTVTNVSVNDSGALYRCQPVTGVNSMTVTITVLDPPAITSVNPSNICTNDFTVSWTAASDEEGISYGVTLLPLNVTVNPIMDTSYNITDLMPATPYTVHVFSAINTCIGIPDVTTVTTLAVEVAVPQSVSNLRSTRITNTTIAVKWNPANSPSGCGPVFYYTVTIMNATYANAIETSETTATFSNLEDGFQYNISVVAVNREGTGPSRQISVTTGNPPPNGDDDNDSNDNNTGAIIGGIIGGIVFLVIVSALITIIIIWWRNNNKNDNVEKLTSSTSPESPSPDKSDLKTKKKSGQKPDKKKATSVEQQPVHDAPQYADLQHGTPGAPPSVDRSKVAYCEVKEHEPLKYAEVEHKPGSDEKNIHGAPRVEYKEVWHQ